MGMNTLYPMEARVAKVQVIKGTHQLTHSPARAEALNGAEASCLIINPPYDAAVAQFVFVHPPHCHHSIKFYLADQLFSNKAAPSF